MTERLLVWIIGTAVAAALGWTTGDFIVHGLRESAQTVQGSLP